MTHPKRRWDPNQLAKSIIDIATGEKPCRDRTDPLPRHEGGRQLRRLTSASFDRPFRKVKPRISPRPDLTGAGYIRPRHHQFLFRHSGLAVVND
jgi:hypothetical protein